MFVFLDTETTGLEYEDQIIQLSYIITDDKFEIVESKNYYFDVDVEISSKATQIHGIDKEKIMELSKGKKFKDYAKDILWDFQNAKVICHNADFDTRFLKKEFERIGKSLFLRNTFCTMLEYDKVLEIYHEYYGTKWPKLIEVVDFLKLDIDNLKMKAMELFGSTGEFHDARLDVYTTYEIYKALREDIVNDYIEKIKEEANGLTIDVDFKYVQNLERDIENLRIIVGKFDNFEDREMKNLESTTQPVQAIDDDIPF